MKWRRFLYWLYRALPERLRWPKDLLVYENDAILPGNWLISHGLFRDTLVSGKDDSERLVALIGDNYRFIASTADSTKPEAQS